MSTLLQDVRYGLRMLANNPSFTAVAVVTLALGIGANTAIFSVVYGVLLRPLPYPKPQQIVEIREVSAKGNPMNFTDPNFEDLRSQNRSLQGMAEYAARTQSVSGGSEPTRAVVAAVSSDFFPVMGVQPVLGRGFVAEDQHLGAAPVALISHGLWRQSLGGIADLSKIKLSGAWQTSKSAWDRFWGAIPVIGPPAVMWSQRLRRSVVNLASPGQLFEDLGITYIGVIPGHDIHALLQTFARVLELKGPVLVHVQTQKGRGYRPAEKDQVSFHGAALPPMDLAPQGDSFDGSGARPATVAAAGEAKAIRPGSPHGAGSNGDALAPPTPASAPRNPSYTSVFVAELIDLAKDDPRIVAITAGMPTGTGLAKFQAAYPDRFHDVGIAEQHAVTMASGLAIGGMRPVVALYSTFLQRAFDQIVHDVCQNDLPVLLAVDRAGLVGEDGTSHQGMFAIPAQRQLPYLVVASPKDEQELRSLLHTALEQAHPFALHYPRDPGFGCPALEPHAIPVGQAEVLRDGDDILFVGFGPIVMRALAVADELAQDGWSIGVVNARFAKPLDRQLILDQARGKGLVVTFEESVVAGGFGSAVLEAVEEARLTDPTLRQTAVRILGIPADRFVDHGAVAELRRMLRLDAPGLAEQVREAVAALALQPSHPAPVREAARAV